jgi:hypothetical protein
MLYLSLFLTAIYLLITNLAAWRGRTLGTACALSWLGLLPGACISSRAFLLSAAITGVAGLVCLWAKGGGRSFFLCSLSATVLGYGVVGGMMAREINGLARRYPLESMAERLAYERREASRSGGGLRVGDGGDKGAVARLARMEDEIDSAQHQGPYFRRNRALKLLHEDRVGRFINSPGFGVFRGTYFTTGTAVELPEAPSVPLPAEELDYPVPQQVKADVHGADIRADQLETFHEKGLLDFGGPLEFGYVWDRQHVAGFQPHRFREMPAAPPVRWELRRLELVSLLKFPEPAVYLSDNLPRMDELRDAQTRPLDPFEGEALSSLRRGEDLVSRQAGDSLRVLGSIRAAKQCTSCHDVQRGTLLGAFSYKLRRK